MMNQAKCPDSIEYLIDSYEDTKVVYGGEVFQQFMNLLTLENAKKVLVFTGKNSADKSGAWRKLLNSCSYLDCDIERFSDINPEPDIDTVLKMRKKIDIYGYFN